MSSKLIFKMVFVIILTAILCGLIFIIYDKAGTGAHIYVADYVIIDENEICETGEEFLWEDEEYEYYLPCLSSYKIFLEWTDGDKDLIKNALNNGKVDIDSLLKHGLKVNIHEKG